MFRRLFITFTFAFVWLLVFGLVAQAQEQSKNTPTEITRNVSEARIANHTIPKSMKTGPVYTNFKGVQLGMTADEVREKLGNVKDKAESQDFFVLSDSTTAQVFYDEAGKVIAFSVDYIGSKSDAPSPEDVLGHDVQALPDGRLHQLNRYPEAGYWVAYNRTAGDNPTTTITLQKM